MPEATSNSLFDVRPTVIGMLHAPPLPGSPGYGGDLAAVRRRVRDDAIALRDGGVHALLLENFGDSPFYPGSVPPATIAHMTALAAAVREVFDGPLGINVLRNDGCSAMAVAHAAGAQFIRVNILTGARVSDQGVIQGIAHDLMRLRRDLGAQSIAVLADVNVKHSAALADIPLAQEVADLLHRGGADGLVVSGTGTGEATEPAQLQQVAAAAAGAAPVLVGSGVGTGNLADYRRWADGFIVGSSLKVDGRVTGPIDPRRVRELMAGLTR